MTMLTFYYNRSLVLPVGKLLIPLEANRDSAFRAKIKIGIYFKNLP